MVGMNGEKDFWGEPGRRGSVRWELPTMPEGPLAGLPVEISALRNQEHTLYVAGRRGGHPERIRCDILSLPLGSFFRPFFYQDPLFLLGFLKNR